tara:strand:- start:225 stop:680 length:456 start_codon:yes stop_codon:yes gene_type:complete
MTHNDENISFNSLLNKMEENIQKKHENNENTSIYSTMIVLPFIGFITSFSILIESFFNIFLSVLEQNETIRNYIKKIWNYFFKWYELFIDITIFLKKGLLKKDDRETIQKSFNSISDNISTNYKKLSDSIHSIVKDEMKNKYNHYTTRDNI